MMCRLQYQSWDDRTVSVDLKPGRHRIGRNPDNDIVIDELAVSGCHCLMTVESGGGIRIQDLDSITGVFVDGAPVDASEVHPGQIIHLGTFMLKVMGAEDQSFSAGTRRLESVPLSDGSYSCLKHQDQRAAYECEHCYHLFCDACMPDGFDRASSTLMCPACGKEAIAIDWSGLSMSTRDAAMEMVPDSVKTALNYWSKWKDYRDARGNDKDSAGKDQSV